MIFLPFATFAIFSADLIMYFKSAAPPGPDVAVGVFTAKNYLRALN